MRAHYELKSFSFRSFIAEKLVELDFQLSLADPDVWLCAATKNDGEEYYENIRRTTLITWSFDGSYFVMMSLNLF